MIELGSFALIVALILAIYAAVAGLIGGRASQYGERRLIASAEHAGYVVCIALSTAVLVLEWALVTRQFQVKYVANYTSNSLPIPYTIAALWAGQAGSLRLWGWLVSVFHLIVSRLYRDRHPELMPYVTSVMMG
jgi:cytochrome c-type biogenesis protein CcmF